MKIEEPTLTVEDGTGLAEELADLGASVTLSIEQTGELQEGTNLPKPPVVQLHVSAPPGGALPVAVITAIQNHDKAGIANGDLVVT